MSNLEINVLGDVVVGAINDEEMYEGRFCKLAGSASYDIPAALYPTSAAEAALAHYCVAFPEDQRSLPIYQPQPAFSYALRGGWDQASNVPFTAAVYTTHPGNMETQVAIPSGFGVKLYGQGCIVTVPSGAYIYSSSIQAGAPLSVNYTAGATRGKLFYSTTVVVAEVVKHNLDDESITVRIV